MTVWWQALILLCCMLNCVESSTPSPLLQRNKYNYSFRLVRSTRTRVQQLRKDYVSAALLTGHLITMSSEHRQLRDLPLLSTDFNSWLELTDWERLHAALRDMQSYWNMLDWKRKQLEKREKEQMAGQVGQVGQARQGRQARQAVHSTLPQRIRHIQLDLRDLMRQVSNQMSYMQSSWTKPTSPTVQADSILETSAETAWDDLVEGYIILRDLDLYLTKLARDFLLLASKTHVTQH